jgi:hypothetical protein
MAGLCVASAGEVEVSRLALAVMWRKFMSCAECHHSPAAATLVHVIRRAERAQVPYRLSCYPGRGYIIQRIEEHSTHD